MEILGQVAATLSGLCSACAALAVSWPARSAVTAGRQQTQRERIKGTYKTTLRMIRRYCGELHPDRFVCGSRLFACSLLPVALVMPLAIAASLARNLILQKAFHLARFTKESVFGTVLVVLVLLLPQLGPHLGSDPINASELRKAPKALTFVAAILIACLFSLLVLTLSLV